MTDPVIELCGEFDRDCQLLTQHYRQKSAENSIEHHQLRQQFCQLHGQTLAQRVLAKASSWRPMSEISYAVAELVPELVPTAAQMATEQGLKPEQKKGGEAQQGILFSQWLSQPKAGQWLLDAQRLASHTAIELLPAFEAGECISLGKVKVELKQQAAHISFDNPEVINAEDNQMIANLETAVDLALLSNKVKVGVLRGGVVSHPRYKNKRVYSAGINLKHINQGQLAYSDFLLGRELGYIHKMIRGIRLVDGDEVVEREIPWISVVDTFAIGGGMQLLLCCDLVIAAEDSYACLPAAAEGIVPGVANLRLPQVAGGRLAQQVILQGKRIFARSEDAKWLFDVVVEPPRLERAVEDGIALMGCDAVIANRRMLRQSQEPQGIFQAYMAEFAKVQLQRLYSADVANKTAAFIARSQAAKAQAGHGDDS